MKSKPFLKWAGGKTKLIPFIQKNMPQQTGKRLIEPFAGSAAVSLALDFDAYLLNDTNQDLIGLYRVLKTEKLEFVRFAQSFFTGAFNQEEKFYDLRTEFNASNNAVEKAALFVYLNRHAFNGLCRYNRKGEFNVPFGRYRKPYFPKEEMLAFIAKSDRFELMCGDFQAALNSAETGDVIYCDPPYVPLSETASFTAYAMNDFNLEDQSRLAAAVEQVAQKNIAVLVSNHDTAFTREIYRAARLERVEVQRNIAAKGSSRQKVGELLAVYGA